MLLRLVFLTFHCIQSSSNIPFPPPQKHINNAYLLEKFIAIME